jgi:steroid 5-alpha reductase family enzyme
MSAGFFFLQALSRHSILLNALYYDICATIAVFFISFLFNNSSFYDPYWSIVPIPLSLYFLLHSETSSSPTRKFIVFVLVFIWGMRLTWNFWGRVGGSGGKFGYGAQCEDWRYRLFRQKLGPLLYWPFSFLCFHLLPTLVTFLGCLSLFVVFVEATYDFNIVDVLALVVTAGAVTIEAIADYQLSVFMRAKRREGEILQSGLWRYSRHPNYFGEISFWWGLFLFSLAAQGTNALWTICGPLAVTCVIIASTQLLEKRMQTREGYRAYQKTTSMLVPLFPKRHS